MPRKKKTGKCQICGCEFESSTNPFPKSCKNPACRSKIKSLNNGNVGKQAGKWLTKVCPVCGKTFETRISRENTYCSNDCNLRSEERKENNKRLYTGVSLLDRGYSKEQLKEHIKRNIERNRGNIGKTYSELYGEEKAKEIKKKFSERSSGSGNSMSYESVMERFEIDDYKEAKELMPATGRLGELHPFFGKHHTIESKTKMIETFEKNGHFNIISGYFDGIYFQGTWELKFIIDCKENNIPIKRFDLEPIEYEFEGKLLHYFPDFIIDEDTIIEIKGRLFDNNKINAKKEKAQKEIKNFRHITDVGQNKNPKTFLRLTKEKYGDRIIIKHNPYLAVEKINGN